MKKIMMIAAVAALTCGFSLSAQTRTTCDKKDKCCEMFDDLNLTDAQKQKLKEMRTKRMEARKAAKAESKEQRRAQKEQCEKEMLEEVKSVLTPEQYQKFLEKQAAKSMRKEGLKHHRDGKKGPRHDKKSR